jgi:broad specificity phosphatase PhoE
VGLTFHCTSRAARFWRLSALTAAVGASILRMERQTPKALGGARQFAHPERSIRGWETTHEAQRRIAEAVEPVVAADSGEGNLAIVSHGGVGTFLLCPP